MPNNYLDIIKHYENCYKLHGDNNLGVDWPSKEDANIRYEVMLDIVPEKRGEILDFGCGLAHLLDYCHNSYYHEIAYTGCDLSYQFIKASKEKYNDINFICLNILEQDLPDTYEYIIANGVFTEKNKLSQEEMMVYFKNMLVRLFSFCEEGFAFNVMSKNVDWERGDLFHVSFDEMASILISNLKTRNFTFRHDYGLYEYTVYVWKK